MRPSSSHRAIVPLGGLLLAAAWPAAVAAAAPAPSPAEARRMFEQKCLFCHSNKVIEQRRLTPARWRHVVNQMRERAPLLISRGDVEVIVGYLVHERRLVPPRRPPAPRPEPGDRGAPPPAVAEEMPPETPPPEEAPAGASAGPPGSGPANSRAVLGGAQSSRPPPPTSAFNEVDDPEAEALGPLVIARRCSKCHTLYRVFTRIDSVTIGDLIIERMRRKTGSAISPSDAEMLKRFVRARATR
jgi:hypothetical protein